MNPPTFTRGERVLIKHHGQTYAAEVLLASSNGYSLALGYDGMIAGHVCVLPVLWDDATEAFRTIVGAEAVGVLRVLQ
jgi:hypothetical protein